MSKKNQSKPASHAQREPQPRLEDGSRRDKDDRLSIDTPQVRALLKELQPVIKKLAEYDKKA